MLDRIVNFFTRLFQLIGRGIGFVIGVFTMALHMGRALA
jgi:hypothetical protein